MRLTIHSSFLLWMSVYSTSRTFQIEGPTTVIGIGSATLLGSQEERRMHHLNEFLPPPSSC